jgi:hypothetical protein
VTRSAIGTHQLIRLRIVIIPLLALRAHYQYAYPEWIARNERFTYDDLTPTSPEGTVRRALVGVNDFSAHFGDGRVTSVAADEIALRLW